MKRLYFCEKTQQAKIYAENIGNEGDVYIIIPAIGAYKFEYPSYLSYKDYPFVDKNPVYKANLSAPLFLIDIAEYDKKGNRKPIKTQFIKNYINTLTSYHSDDEMISAKNALINFMESFDEWVVALDNDHTGTRGFDLFISEFLNGYHPFRMRDKSAIKRLDLKAFDAKSLQCAIKNLGDLYNKDNIHQRHVMHYKNKDFFDYNFNINSLMVLEDILKEVGAYKKEGIMTHFMLQTLMLIKTEKKTDIHNLLNVMTSHEIGSMCSRNEMLEQLYGYGLLQKIKQSNKREEWKLSEEGYKFVGLIHQKVRSLNTKEIYKDIQSMDHDSFKAKYSTKLATYFKKQRNYFRNKRDHFKG